MTVSTPTSNLGRHVFGAAAVAFGLITLAWHNYKDLDQLRSVLNATEGPVVVYVVAAAQIVGGAAMQFGRTAKTSAVIVGAVYLAFALLSVPQIFAAPRVYNNWGNFFEQFCLVAGAALVYAQLSSQWEPRTVRRAGCILLGLCAASFALEQAFYLESTARLDVLGESHDGCVRARGRGAAYEPNGVARDSPPDRDARDLWPRRVDTAACGGSP
jgi:uncharacterized membrane protein YphA (DoxX/SURF4 family)